MDIIDIVIGPETPNFKNYYAQQLDVIDENHSTNNESVFSILTNNRSIDIICDDDTVRNKFIRGLSFLQKRLHFDNPSPTVLMRKNSVESQHSNSIKSSNNSNFEIWKPINGKQYLEDTQKRLILSRMMRGDHFLKMKLTAVGYPHERFVRLNRTSNNKFCLAWMGGEKELVLKKIDLSEIVELQVGSFKPPTFEDDDFRRWSVEMETKHLAGMLSNTSSPYNSNNNSNSSLDTTMLDNAADNNNISSSDLTTTSNKTRWERMNRRAAQNKRVNNGGLTNVDEQFSFSLFNKEGINVLSLLAPNSKQFELWKTGLNLIIGSDVTPRGDDNHNSTNNNASNGSSSSNISSTGGRFQHHDYGALSEDDATIMSQLTISRMSSINSLSSVNSGSSDGNNSADNSLRMVSFNLEKAAAPPPQQGQGRPAKSWERGIGLRSAAQTEITLIASLPTTPPKHVIDTVNLLNALFTGKTCNKWADCKLVLQRTDLVPEMGKMEERGVVKKRLKLLKNLLAKIDVDENNDIGNAIIGWCNHLIDEKTTSEPPLAAAATTTTSTTNTTTKVQKLRRGLNKLWGKGGGTTTSGQMRRAKSNENLAAIRDGIADM